MGKAVYIGRFQPFHEGHRQTVKKFMEEYEELIVAIGSPGKSREEENPFTAEERRKMVKNCFPEVKIIEIEDEGETDEDNRKWAEKIDELDLDDVLTNNGLVKRLVEENTSLNSREYDKFEPNIYSGTEVRRRVRSGEEWRYLVPECSVEAVEDFEEKIEKSGKEYSFEPGWSPENVQH